MIASTRCKLYLRRLVLILWLLSFVVPTTVAPDGTVRLGAEVALLGLMSFYLLPGVPVLALGLLSNVLVIRELWQQTRRQTTAPSLGMTLLTVLAATINGVVPLYARPVLPDLYAHPGFWLWAAAFILLAAVSAWEYTSERQYGALMRRLGLRLLAMLAIAAAVYGVGLVTLVLFGTQGA